MIKLLTVSYVQHLFLDVKAHASDKFLKPAPPTDASNDDTLSSVAPRDATSTKSNTSKFRELCRANRWPRPSKARRSSNEDFSDSDRSSHSISSS